ncbi:MAG: phosphatidylserine decarboxylase [Planctomycetota bacterium]
MSLHQYIARESGTVLTEELFGDRIVRFMYSRARESAPWLFAALTGPRWTRWLAHVNFDLPLGDRLTGNRRFLKNCGVVWEECRDDPRSLTTARAIFERKIRYEDCRPMPSDPSAVVSPADARVIVGSFARGSEIFLKDKFFGFEELLGSSKTEWLTAFAGGDYAIFRLTPDKYHYNHTPVAGVVRDVYELSGSYHSCHPEAVIELATPYSKNRRTVTIIDTDVDGGTGVGVVAMIEIVALMIGRVVQCYSRVAYDDPQPVRPGTFLEKGAPKSLYRPGSSTDVVLFQPGRVRFARDLVTNLGHPNATSRFSSGFGQPLVETDVAVRSLIASGEVSNRAR